MIAVNVRDDCVSTVPAALLFGYRPPTGYFCVTAPQPPLFLSYRPPISKHYRGAVLSTLGKDALYAWPQRNSLAINDVSTALFISGKPFVVAIAIAECNDAID